MHFFFSETKYKCINLNGRTEDIIEMQEGNLVDDMDLACSVANMDDDNLPFTTLISMSKNITIIDGIFYVIIDSATLIKNLIIVASVSYLIGYKKLIFVN